MDLGEDIANVAGGGNIAGIGVGEQGEPGVTKRKKPILGIVKRKTFKEFRNAGHRS